MSQNPFDFSDFGPPQRPNVPTPPPGHGSSPSPSPAPATGFDPWANQPPTRSAPPAAPTFGEPSAAASEGFDAFGHPSTTTAPAGPAGAALATAGPPLIWFAAAFALAAAGAIIALIGALSGGALATALVGWLLAGPVAIGALATYTRVDTRRRAEAIYSAPTWAPRLYWAVLAVCMAGIAVGAWQIALWAGRL